MQHQWGILSATTTSAVPNIAKTRHDQLLDTYAYRFCATTNSKCSLGIEFPILGYKPHHPGTASLFFFLLK